MARASTVVSNGPLRGLWNGRELEIAWNVRDALYVRTRHYRDGMSPEVRSAIYAWRRREAESIADLVERNRLIALLHLWGTPD